MQRKLLSISCLVLLIGLVPTLAMAGGMWVYEMATPDMGTASAGRAALADDASTAFSNPAGMTRLQQSQAFVGIQGVIPSVKFSTGEGTNVPGGGGGNAGVAIPSMSAFYVHNVCDKWRLGIALNSYMGGVLDYGDDWAGRYYLQNTTLLTFNLNPVVAYKITDWLSVGAGPMVIYGYMKTDAAINQGFEDLPDGQIRVKSDTVGIGGNIGVLVEPRKGTRLGVTYRTPVDLDFGDVPELRNLGPTFTALFGLAGLYNKKLDLSVTMPQEVMFSFYQDITNKLAVMGNFGWQDWSQFQDFEVNVPTLTGETFTTKLQYQDTYHGAIGVRYRISEPWMIMAGFAYDSSASTTSTRSPVTPFDRQLRYALGAQYNWSERLAIGGAYEFMDAGDASIDRTRGPLSGTLQGDYSSDYYNFIGCYLSYKF